MLARWEHFFYGASLVTLPWVGMGVLKLATGRDWGGGLQLSWVFLALAILCAAVGRLNNERGSYRLPSDLGRWWLLFLKDCLAILI